MTSAERFNMQQRIKEGQRAQERQEQERVEAVRAAYAARVGHVCPKYETARSWAPHWEGPSDPALQDGIGCPICYPPNGRVS